MQVLTSSEWPLSGEGGASLTTRGGSTGSSPGQGGLAPTPEFAHCASAPGAAGAHGPSVPPTQACTENGAHLVGGSDLFSTLGRPRPTPFSVRPALPPVQRKLTPGTLPLWKAPPKPTCNLSRPHPQPGALKGRA